MSDSSPKQVLHNLVRFYKFATPHWKMIVVAFIAMFVCSLVWGSLVLLVRPLAEGVMAQQNANSQTATEQVEDGGSQGGDSGVQTSDNAATTGQTTDTESRLEELEAEAKSWFMSLYPVRKVVNYLRPGPDSLHRVGMVVLVLIAPIMLVASFLQTYARERVTWNVMADLRVSIFAKITRLPLSFFSHRRSGDLISRLTNDITISRNAVKKIFGELVRSPMRLVIYAAIAIYASLKLFILGIVLLPLLVLVLRKFGGRIRRYSRKMLERLGDLTEAVSQMFSGIRVIKAFGMEEEENREFRRKTNRQLQRAFKLVRVRAWANGLPRFVCAAGFGAVLLLSNYLMEQGQIEFGALAMFATALVAMTGPIRRMVKAYNVLQESLGAIERLFEILNAKEEVKDPPDALELDGVKEGVVYENVSFAYDDEYVLKDINLSVNAGEVCAIVGETGAGKSTLLDLLPRFYEPQEGTIRIDGVDIRNIKRQSLLDHIAVVGQSPFLFNRSIEENIRYGKPSATDEEIREAARAASVHEFVSSLPKGYQTMVGERGGRLSGGQRQCITMARAILKDSPILILDEATSDLDSESEQVVQRALENLTRDRTTFIIAHRLSTVLHADKIIVMKNGRIIERGPHAELLELGGEYEKLYRLQFGAPAAHAASSQGGISDDTVE